MKIREASLKDVGPIAAMANSAFHCSFRWLAPLRWAEKYVVDLLGEKSIHIWIAEQDGDCRGFLIQVTNHEDICKVKSGNKISLAEVVAKALGNPLRILRMLLRKGFRPAGQVCYSIVRKEGSAGGESWIELVAVHSLARKNGVGRALINHCLDRDRENHVCRTSLLVGEDNRPAISLYESSGFIKCD